MYRINIILTRVHSAQITTVIKTAKTFLQMFIKQCCSLGKSRKKLQHESYQRQHTQSEPASHGVTMDKQVVKKEIRE